VPEKSKFLSSVIHQRVPVLVDAFDPHGLHMAKGPVRQYMQGSNKDPVRPGPVEIGPDAPPQGATDNHCSWGYNPAGLAYGDTIWIQAGR
jgi:hypothetical protein